MNRTSLILFMISVVPLMWMNGFIFPPVTSKALLFFFLVELALLWFIFKMKERFSIQVRPLDMILFILVALVIVASLISDNTYVSLWSTVARMSGAVLWLHLLICAVLIRSQFKDKDFHIFFCLSFIVSSVVSLHGLTQHTSGIPPPIDEGRIDILFGNPVFLSIYLLFNIGIGCLLFVRTKQNFLRYVIASFVGLHILVLFYTGTRGALLGLLCATIIGCFVYAISHSASQRLRVVCIGIAIIAVGLLGSIFAFNDHQFFLSNPILKRFSVISVSNLQNQARYYIWEAALDGIRQNPVWGVGMENFSDIFNEYQDPEYLAKDHLSSLPEMWVDRTHNAFLDLASGAGVPAMFVFIALLFYTLYVFYTTEQLKDRERSILVAIVVAYLIHSLFSFNMPVDLVWLIIICTYASHLDTRTFQFSYTAHPYVHLTVKGGVVCLCILALLSTGNRAVFAYEIRSMLSKTIDNSTEEFEGYNAFINKNFIDKPYALRQLPIVGTEALVAEKPNKKDRAKMIALVANAEHSLRTYGPLSIKDMYYYGQFYENADAPDEAERMYTEALKKAPQNQLMLVAYSKFLLEEDQKEKAYEYAQKAYVLEPTFNDAAFTYLSTLIATDQTEKADRIVLESFGENISAQKFLRRQLEKK